MDFTAMVSALPEQTLGEIMELILEAQEPWWGTPDPTEAYTASWGPWNGRSVDWWGPRGRGQSGVVPTE